MSKVKLTTKGAVDALPHPTKGQAVWWDTELRGFGVLVGVQSKSFVFQRVVKGRSRRISLGRYPDVSLHAARKEAERLAGLMRSGVDPLEQTRKATADNMTLREAWGLYEQHLVAKERSPRTGDGYWKSLQRYCSDWLDRPLVEITTHAAHARHVHIGTTNGKYAANATFVALRAIWRRALRQYPELPAAPTGNVDFYPDKPRTAVVTVDVLPAWWDGVQKIANPVRRDFYIWLLFTGCRRTETQTLQWTQVDLTKRSVHFSKTKTEPFDLPLSDFLVELLQARRTCTLTQAVHGADCPWVFPTHSKAGHITEPQLNEKELKLFPCPWSPHTLRHTWITISENKISMPATHSRLLSNHAVPHSRDAHLGYIHPGVDDLRRSQQMMTDFLLTAIRPVSIDNVVPLRDTKRNWT